MKKISPDEVLATTACFRQRVNLPAAQVAGLAETELAAALAFECEPFSGIPRSEGEMAWRRLGGEGDARSQPRPLPARASRTSPGYRFAKAARLPCARARFWRLPLCLFWH